MGIYILRRLALIIPTLIGIMLLNFVIVQAAPGGPVEQLIAEMEGHGGSALARASGGGSGGEVADSSGDTRGSRGIPDELLKEIEVMYGFDKPAHERFFKMLGDYATFNFGDSFFREKKCYRPDSRQNARIHFPGPLVDTDHLFYFHPPGYPKGRYRRLQV